MIGIAISVYDKFEEVQILVDIIRNNWKNKYFISLCSNHPEAKKHLDKLDVDHFIQGAEINFSPKMLSQPKGRINLICRVLDTIKKSCQGGIDGGCDYVMHIHSDAWPLDETKFLELIQMTKESGKKIAIRGMGLTMYSADIPLGHVDDMFFVFDAKHFAEIDFFNYHPLELLPHKNSVHGCFILLLYNKIGIKNIYYYSFHRNLEYWDGNKKILPFHRAKPSIFDPNYKFLHVHTTAFPMTYGNSIQAHYLKKMGLTQGKFISKYLEKYLMDEGELFEILANIERKLDRKLKLRRINPVIFGRDFSLKEKKLQNFRKYRRFRFKNYLSKIKRAVFGGTNIQKRSLYVDSLWPEKADLAEYYREIIDTEDFPEEYQYFWFLEK